MANCQRYSKLKPAVAFKVRFVALGIKPGQGMIIKVSKEKASAPLTTLVLFFGGNLYSVLLPGNTNLDNIFLSFCANSFFLFFFSARVGKILKKKFFLRKIENKKKRGQRNCIYARKKS